MKSYSFYGTHTTLSDEDGEILLNMPGQIVELEEERALRHIAAGAPIKEVIEPKEIHVSVKPVI
jgi:hypothetical protein